MNIGSIKAPALCRIVLIDEHVIMLSGLKAMLSSKPNFRVMATVTDPRQVTAQLLLTKPQLVIMDVSPPVTNFINTIQTIKGLFPDIRIIALTFLKEANIVSAAFEAGIDAYVLKEDPYEELLEAIETVIEGNAFVSPSVASKAPAC